MNTESNKKNTTSNKNYTAKTHYKGNVAKSYLSNRTRSLKWRKEQNLMSKMISNLPKGSWILDIPVGTGRLLPFYAKGNYPVYGMDISEDMLAESKQAHKDMDNIQDFIEGNAENIPLPDESVDYVICLRLLNLVPLAVLENMIKEFKRVSRIGMIIEVRVTKQCGRLRLIQKMLSDPHTHFNRLIYTFYIWFKNTFVKSIDKNNEKIISQDSETYCLHNAEDISRILLEQVLITNKITEVDKGLDYKHRVYKPLLIIDCSK